MKVFILGVSSDIGLSLATYWASVGYSVSGTYRTLSIELDTKRHEFANLYYCDLAEEQSINLCIDQIKNDGLDWDVFVACPGTMMPLGSFQDCDIDEWVGGLNLNLIAPLKFLHNLLNIRSRDNPSIKTVIFFAGGGSNSAPLGVSSYTISKIALIKAVELFDAEVEDIKFSILGPGWVKTKIHNETLSTLSNDDDSYIETKRRLEQGDFNSMDNVIEACDWIVKSEKSIVGGRNFSSVHDEFSSSTLSDALASDINMFKLRRYGNKG